MATKSTLSTKIPMGKIFLIITFLLIVNCSKVEFDGFDPTTSTVKWIIKKDKK